MTTYRTELNNRDLMAEKSIQSLIQNTTYPYEFILIDNTQNNRGLGKARNLGISMASGDALCITDDDIWFQPHWLEDCVEILKLGKKFIATPVHQPKVGKWELEPYMGYRRNYRTGSNCMVMWKDTLKDTGLFMEGFEPKRNCVKIGHKYSDKISRAGYTFLITKEAGGVDMGIYKHAYL